MVIGCYVPSTDLMRLTWEMKGRNLSELPSINATSSNTSGEYKVKQQSISSWHLQIVRAAMLCVALFHKLILLYLDIRLIYSCDHKSLTFMTLYAVVCIIL